MGAIRRWENTKTSFVLYRYSLQQTRRPTFLGCAHQASLSGKHLWCKDLRGWYCAKFAKRTRDENWRNCAVRARRFRLHKLSVIDAVIWKLGNSHPWTKGASSTPGRKSTGSDSYRQRGTGVDHCMSKSKSQNMPIFIETVEKLKQKMNFAIWAHSKSNEFNHLVSAKLKLTRKSVHKYQNMTKSVLYHPENFVDIRIYHQNNARYSQSRDMTPN